MNKLAKVTITSFLVMAISCEDSEADKDHLPEFGSISGTVNFVGTFPDTGEALITLDTQWPPAGPPAGFSYITSSDVENGVYDYSFSNLSFRTYEAITVTYWPEGYVTAGTNYILIGSHIETINVTQDNADLTINIDATFN